MKIEITEEEISTIKYALIDNIFDLADDLGLDVEESELKNKSISELCKELDFLYETYNK